jgi:hypothetical protein
MEPQGSLLCSQEPATFNQITSGGGGGGQLIYSFVKDFFHNTFSAIDYTASNGSVIRKLDKQLHHKLSH